MRSGSPPTGLLRQPLPYLELSLGGKNVSNWPTSVPYTWTHPHARQGENQRPRVVAELWDSDAGDTEGEEDGPSDPPASPGARHHPSKQQQDQGWSIYGLTDVEGRLFGSSMSFGAGGG